jgi:hypothetical protein
MTKHAGVEIVSVALRSHPLPKSPALTDPKPKVIE